MSPFNDPRKRKESQRIWEQTLKSFITENIKGLGKYIKTIPPRYQRRWYRCFIGDSSKPDAIRAKCMDCSGYDTKEVKNCNVFSCPLHKYRPYQEKS